MTVSYRLRFSDKEMYALSKLLSFYLENKDYFNTERIEVSSLQDKIKKTNSWRQWLNER